MRAWLRGWSGIFELLDFFPGFPSSAYRVNILATVPATSAPPFGWLTSARHGPLMHRLIVHDPDILSGRWHVAGTQIAIADICLDHRDAQPVDGEPYQYRDLTSAEIQHALDWEFPAVRETHTSMLLAMLTVHCECGEDTHQTVSEWPVLDIDCVCGRIWGVKVIVVPKQHPEGVHQLFG